MSRLKLEYNGKSIVRDVFIETGTYHGESLEIAARGGFKECYSIESDPEMMKIARQRLGGLNVGIFTGKSVDVLGVIIDRSKPTTFWLDAHTDASCPLLDELKEIFKEPWAVSPLVIIDDSGMFAEGRCNPEIWPSFAQIERQLPRNFSIHHTGKPYGEVMLCGDNTWAT